MEYLWIMVISCVYFGSSRSENVDLRFPDNFLFGAGTAAYQTEGAWNISGKGESIWDRYTHVSKYIADGSNGDIACNTYYKYKEDVQRIKSIGLDLYRFSISWSRVLPTGFTNVINEEGLQFYKNLTEELAANGIEPIVTLYHWDHPQVLEDMGGWTNEIMIDLFVAYARVIFDALGHRVKIWTTINEPATLCGFGYEKAEIRYAPGKSLNHMGKYLCAHNMLKAHALTYHMYNEEFRATQHGQISILLSCSGHIATNSSYSDYAETAFQFECGWLAHPIYIGDYPEIMKTRIAAISKAQGYSKSRLPEFSKEWISIIKGTWDYFGLNHYSSDLISPDPDLYNSDVGVIMGADPNWPTSAVSWIHDYPPGFGILLRKIKDDYNNPPVRIMENGYPDKGELYDYARIHYHHGYLKELLIAMKRDGCNVKSYCIWSFMDVFEWADGYTVKFGITGVGFQHSERIRTAKRSTLWWKKVLETRQLQPVPSIGKYQEKRKLKQYGLSTYKLKPESHRMCTVHGYAITMLGIYDKQNWSTLPR